PGAALRGPSGSCVLAHPVRAARAIGVSMPRRRARVRTFSAAPGSVVTPRPLGLGPTAAGGAGTAVARPRPIVLRIRSTRATMVCAVLLVAPAVPAHARLLSPRSDASAVD